MAERPAFPDPLAGLSSAARLRKELEDIRFIAANRNVKKFADPVALARPNNTFAGSDILRSPNLKPYDAAGAPFDFVICDHPIYFADNNFVHCADCGCDLQCRPDVPPQPPKICVCCAARRVRERAT